MDVTRLSPGGLGLAPALVPTTHSGPGPASPQELLHQLLHLHFRDHRTKVSADALRLTAELLRIFVVEAAVRGVRQAQAEDVAQVDVEQLEKVLPQLLLDF